MEIFRHAGVQDVVEAAAATEFVQNGAIVAVESLCGKELQYFYTSWNEGVEDLSVTSRLFITQVGLEPLLRKAARDLGATHHFGAQLLGVEQDESGVTARVRSRDSGNEHTIRSQYLVAADGAHSSTRQALGIDMPGHGTADCITIYFDADMREMIGDRNLSVIYVLHPDLLGFFRFSFDRGSGFLSVFSVTDPATGEHHDLGGDIPDELAQTWVRLALGCATDTPVTIDSVQHWEASADCAARFRQGRIFLAGDAAHTMPPTGGWGGNTGVADAHNLAWKLAMVVRGEAQPELLDSYDQERRPTALMTVEQAYSIYAGRYAERASADDTKALSPERPAEHIELGGIYRSTALVDPAGALYADHEEAQTRDPRAPGVPVGARIPHLMLRRDWQHVSTHDLCDDTFTLIAGTDGNPWCDAALALATGGMPLRVHTIGPDGDLVADADELESRLGLTPSSALIVRPDGVVAWRSAAVHTDPEGELRHVLNTLLAREVATVG